MNLSKRLPCSITTKKLIHSLQTVISLENARAVTQKELMATNVKNVEVHSPTELINPKSAISGSQPVMKETKHWYLPLDKHESWLRQWITGRS